MTVFKQLNFRPKKYLGQNFLIDKNVLEKIVDAAELKKDDIVLEVGPGFGNLTEELAKKSGKIIAVEKDKRLVEVLQKKFAGQKNVEIIEGDILKILNLKSKISNLKYKVVANIPYYITSHFLRLILEAKNKPKIIVLLIQKEVAQRICAQKGQNSLLSLSVQYYGKPQILAYVSANSFNPKPKVDSAILKIEVFETPPYKIDNEKAFFSLIRGIFSQKRKQILNTFAKYLKIYRLKPELQKNEAGRLLKSCQIAPTLRPQDLGLDDFKKLYFLIHTHILDKK